MARFLDGYKPRNKKKKDEETVKKVQSPSVSKPAQRAKQAQNQKMYGGTKQQPVKRATTNNNKTTTQRRQQTTSQQTQRTVDRLTSKYGQNRVQRNQQEIDERRQASNQRRLEAQRQKSGFNSMASKETQEAANRAIRNTPGLVKKALKDTVSGHLQTIADITEMTASSKTGAKAKAMKMGIDPEKDKAQMAEVERERQRTAEAARLDREKWAEEQEKRQQDWDKKVNGAEGVEKAYYGAVESGTGMLTDLALGLGTQGGSLAAMFSRTYGQTRGQAEKEGATESEDRTYATLQAIKEVGTELMFPGVGLARGYAKKTGLPIAERIANNLTSRIANRTAADLTGAGVRLLGGTAEENLEEVAGFGLDPLIREFSYGRNVRTRQKMTDLQNESDQLRANIRSEDDARRVASYLNSSDWLDQNKQQYLEAGLSEKQAQEVAEKMRDYMTASLTGDTETMDALEQEIASTLSKGEFSYGKSLDKSELLDTLASTTLLTLTTGLPGTATTAMRGSVIRDNLGADGIRTLAESAMNYEDPEASKRGQVARDRINAGKELTASEVYELAASQAQQVEKDTQRVVTKNNVVADTLESERLVVPMIMRDDKGNIHGDPIIMQRYNDSEQEAENALRDLDNDQKLSLSDSELAVGSRAIAGFQTGAFTINDANALNYTNTAIRTAFEQVTGVDLGQYVVKTSSGAVDYAATNAATKDALFKLATDNFIETARAETENFKDQAKGITAEDMAQRVGSEGDKAITIALDTVDPADEDTYGLMASAAQNVYEYGRFTEDTWNDVSANLSEMYPGLSQEALQDVYEAAKRDKTIAENPYYNARITAGESTRNMDMSEADQAEYGKFTNETGEDIGIKERAVLESLASEFNINIRLLPSEFFEYKYADRKGNEKTAYSNGSYDPKTGTMLLNGGNDMDRNLVAVALHEVTHHIAIYAPKEYLALSNRVMETWYKNDVNAFNAAIKRKQDSYKAQVGQNLSEEQALEEVIADAVGEMNADPDFISQICTEEPTLAEQIINAIKSVLRKLRAILASGNVAEEYEDAFFNQLGIWDDAQRLWMQAAKVAQQQRANQAIDDWDANARQTAENENRHSITDTDVADLDKTDSILENENGEPVAQFYESGAVKFSLKTSEDGGRDTLQQYLDNLVANNELSQKDADDMMREYDLMYNICKDLADSKKYAPFSAWSVANIVTDNNGKSVFSAIKKNSEYKMNIDFSTICKKRRTLDAVFREMINRGMFERLDLNKEQSAEMVVHINDLIRKHGFEAACALCFVEARRYRQQQTATTFRDMYNNLVESLYSDKSKIAYFNYGEDSTVEDVPDGIHTMDDSQLDFSKVRAIAEERTDKGTLKQTAEAKAARLILNDPNQRKLMRVGDMMASTGFENMQVQNPELMKVYNSKKGTGGAKSSFGDVQYQNEIIKSKTFDRINAFDVSGVRIQSFSDYVPRMVFDYIEVIADLAAKRLPAHAYTKEVLFARQFGLTGAKINLSLVPDVVEDGTAPGLDANGNYIWNEEGTFPYEEAMELQKAEGYKDNCGTIAVGISDEQIRKMLADPTIQMVIPYHKSSLNPIVAAMTNVDRFTDYTDFQNTKNAEGKTVKRDFNWDHKLFRLTHDAKGNLLPKDKWGNVQDLVQEYVTWCEKKNYTPKFSQFLYMEDGSINPGYYKLLEDFALLDNDGNFKPQGDVQMRFPTEESAFGGMKDLIEQGLEEDAILEGKRQNDINGIVDEIERMAEEGTLASDFRYSITPEMDEEYMKAVNSGNMEEAKRLVGEAAKRAGYNVHVYHGTLSEPFNRFMRPADNQYRYTTGSGFIYATPSEDYAENYAYRGEPFTEDYDEGFVMEGYMNISNLLDVGSVDDEMFGGTDFRNPDFNDEEKINSLATNDLKGVAKAVNMTPYELIHYLGEEIYRDSEAVWDLVNRPKFTELIREQGHDGIKLFEWNADAYGVPEPTQIKLADAVTYAEDGSIIPLSERFNPENDDIRYSLPTEDSDGNILSDGQMEYFKNSQARDAQGRLVPMYHGTENAGFTIFDSDYGNSSRFFFFADSIDRAKGYSGTHDIFNAKNYETVDEANEYIKSWGNEDKVVQDGDDFIILEDGDEILRNSSLSDLMMEYDEYSGFGGTSANYKVYLNVEKPLVIDAGGNSWDAIPYDDDIVTTNWLAEYAYEEGYDGLIVDNVLDYGLYSSAREQVPQRDIVVFSSSQIKDTRNTEPSDNPDIRFSITDEDTALDSIARYADTTDRIPSRDAVIDEGRLRMSISEDDFINKTSSTWNEADLTHGMVLAEDSVKRNIIKMMSYVMKESGTGKKYRSNTLDETIKSASIMFYLAKAGKAEKASEYAWNAARRIVDDIDYNDNLYTKYKNMRDYLRKTKIAVPEGLEYDESFAEFARDNRDRLLLKDKGRTVDSVYKSLRKYWPEMFAEDVTDPIDQLLQIDYVLDYIQPYREAYTSEAYTELVDQVATSLCDIVAQGEEYHSVADVLTEKYDAKVKAMKQRHQEAQRKLRETEKEKRTRLTERANETLERRTAELEAKRENQRQRAENWKQKYQDRLKKDAEDREERRERKFHKDKFDKIKDDYDWLVKRVLDPTKDKYVPEEFRKSLAEFLQTLDLQTENSKELEAKTGHVAYKTFKMRELKDRLLALAASKSEDGVGMFELDSYVPYILDALTKKLDETGNTIDSLDASDIDQVQILMRAIRHNLDNYNKRIKEGKAEEISALGAEVVSDQLKRVEKRGAAKEFEKGARGTMDVINSASLTPPYFFERLGNGMKGMYDELRYDGFDTYIRNERLITDRLTAILGKYKKTSKLRKNKPRPGSELQEWRDSRSAQTFKLTAPNESVTLTVAQMMSLYCLQNRDQAMQHILKGGIHVTPIQTGSKLKSFAERYTGKKVNAETVHLTIEDVRRICTALTPEQKQVADDLQQLMAVDMAKLGNEAHRKMYGYEIFNDPNYFPIKSRDNEIQLDINKIGDVVEKIKSFGPAKPLDPNASNTIEVDDIFTVTADHCNGMNLYNAYLVPISNFVRVYNYKYPMENGSTLSVKDAIEQAHSKKALTYITNFLKDLNGIKPVQRGGLEDVMNKALGTAKKTSVFGNIRVALQQPTAIVRALAVMSPDHFIPILNMPLYLPASLGGKAKADLTEEMYKYAPIAQWKSWGFYDTYMGRDIEDVMMNNWSTSDVALSGLYGALDNWTWSFIWRAVKDEQAKAHPKMDTSSEEFLQLCGRRASEVFDKTQVVDSTFHRSDAMRSKQVAVKAFTAFMAEPTLTLNVFRAGIDNAREASLDGNLGKATLIFNRALGVILVQAAVVSAAQAFADAWRGKDPGWPGDDDDDDDKEAEFWTRFIHNYVQNLFDQLHLENNIYLVKDVTPYFNFMVSKAADYYDLNPWLRAALGWDQDYLYSDNNLVMSTLENLAKGVEQAFKKKAKGDKYDKRWYDINQKVAGGIGTFFGIPAGTLMRDFKPIWDKVFESAFAADEMSSASSEDGAEPISSIRFEGISDGSFVDNALNRFGINLTDDEIHQREVAKAQAEYQKKVDKITNSLSEYSGEEYDKHLWDKSDLEGYGKALSEGDFKRAEEIEQMFLECGGSQEFIEDKKLYHYKKNYAKTIVYDPTDEQVEQQQQMKEFLLSHGMSEAELSEKVYKSQTTKELKVAFRLNDEDAIIEELQPLIRAGLSYDDFVKAYENRNRIDLKKYKDGGGKYAERLQSTGTYNWPITGQITSNFGHRSSPGGIGSTNHQGLDIAGNMGDPVGAADGGTVVYAGWYGGAGKTVMIEHDDGTVTQYSHLSWYEAKVGDTVAQGQTIGNVGSTGNSTGPHLHFGVKVNGKYVDPLTKLN